MVIASPKGVAISFLKIVEHIMSALFDAIAEPVPSFFEEIASLLRRSSQ